MERNFRKYDNKTVQLLGTPYDISKSIIIKHCIIQHLGTTLLIILFKFYHLILESIMHYGSYFFANDTRKPTITEKSGNIIVPSADFTLVQYNTYIT